MDVAIIPPDRCCLYTSEVLDRVHSSSWVGHFKYFKKENSGSEGLTMECFTYDLLYLDERHGALTIVI